MVKQQVESQIKVRDFSRTSVTLEPAEYSSWSEARNELMAEAKNSLRAKLESELGAKVGDESAIAGLKSEFEQKERDLEHSIGATCICVPLFLSQPSKKMTASALPALQITRSTPSRPAWTCSTTSSPNRRLVFSVLGWYVGSVSHNKE